MALPPEGLNGLNAAARHADFLAGAPLWPLFIVATVFSRWPFSSLSAGARLTTASCSFSGCFGDLDSVMQYSAGRQRHGAQGGSAFSPHPGKLSAWWRGPCPFPPALVSRARSPGAPSRWATRAWGGSYESDPGHIVRLVLAGRFVSGARYAAAARSCHKWPGRLLVIRVLLVPMGSKLPLEPECSVPSLRPAPPRLVAFLRMVEPGDAAIQVGVACSRNGLYVNFRNSPDGPRHTLVGGSVATPAGRCGGHQTVRCHHQACHGYRDRDRDRVSCVVWDGLSLSDAARTRPSYPSPSTPLRCRDEQSSPRGCVGPDPTHNSTRREEEEGARARIRQEVDTKLTVAVTTKSAKQEVIRGVPFIRPYSLTLKGSMGGLRPKRGRNRCTTALQGVIRRGPNPTGGLLAE